MRLHNIAAGLLMAGALTSATSTLTTPAPPAPVAHSSTGWIGIRLVDAPVELRADSRARRYIIDHLAPGTVIHRRLEVSNTTRSPQHVALYPAGAQIQQHKFQFAPGHTANELSTWTSINRHEVILAPHTRSLVTATVTVPKDAAPGEHYSMIWAEMTKDPPPGGGVREINRVGIRMYLSVGGGNPPAADFTIDSLTAQRAPTGQQIVSAQVRNTGGRALDLSGELSLSGKSLHAGPFTVQTGTTLAPGDSGPVTVPLPEQIPNGPWNARLRLESGTTRHTARATIQFPSTAGTAQAVTAKDDISYPAVALLAVLSAAAAATILLIHTKRRSH
ncbi:hypothetical protein Mame01_28900 [Microbispora amethystogenes]|nr:hypothetical protein Mame01_28900 [Microbispora amethystogenes]